VVLDSLEQRDGGDWAGGRGGAGADDEAGERAGVGRRTIHPELYAASTIKRGAEQIVVMTKKDHTEVTAFWVHGDRDLNIALTSTDPKDNLTEFMDTIIPSIRWKQ
jgi:hypothetical protein